MSLSVMSDFKYIGIHLRADKTWYINLNCESIKTLKGDQLFELAYELKTFCVDFIGLLNIFDGEMNYQQISNYIQQAALLHDQKYDNELILQIADYFQDISEHYEHIMGKWRFHEQEVINSIKKIRERILFDKEIDQKERRRLASIISYFDDLENFEKL